MSITRWSDSNRRASNLLRTGTTWASPENYVGYERSQGFASPGGVVPDQPHRYTAPSSLGRNQWALSGNWRIGPVATILEEAGGGIAFAFHARDLNLVMRPAVPHTSLLFRVLIDGQPPGPAHGLDVGEDGNGTVSDQRLYQLVRQPERSPTGASTSSYSTRASKHSCSRSDDAGWPMTPAVTLSGCRWPPAARAAARPGSGADRGPASTVVPATRSSAPRRCARRDKRKRGSTRRPTCEG